MVVVLARAGFFSSSRPAKLKLNEKNGMRKA